jgi:F0F1-type ATP synthase epsilon subunit
VCVCAPFPPLSLFSSSTLLVLLRMLARACVRSSRAVAVAARGASAGAFRAPSVAAVQSRRLAAEAEAEKVTEGMVRFRLSCPHAAIVPQAEVISASVPGVSGEFEVNADHVPTVAELQPGVVRVQGGADGDQEFFINGGFCVVHKDNTVDVSAIEAIPVSEIDADAAKNALRQFEADLAAARDEEATTEAEIGIEVTQAMILATGA